MTRVHIPDQCLHNDEHGECQNPGGEKLLCEVHAPIYRIDTIGSYIGNGGGFDPEQQQPAEAEEPGDE